MFMVTNRITVFKPTNENFIPNSSVNVFGWIKGAKVHSTLVECNYRLGHHKKKPLILATFLQR